MLAPVCIQQCTVLRMRCIHQAHYSFYSCYCEKIRRRDYVLVVCLVPRMPPKPSRSRGSRGRSRPYPSRSVGSRSSSRSGGTISPSPRSSSPPQPVSSTNVQFLGMIREEVRQQLSYFGSPGGLDPLVTGQLSTALPVTTQVSLATSHLPPPPGSTSCSG